MKKFILFLAAATLVAGNTFAQYKPTAGSVSTEIQFNPFDQNGKTFSLDGVKVRYFFDENNALRLKLGLNMTSETSKADDSKDDFKTDKYGSFTLDLGYEYHFGLSKRIDLYAGVQVGIAKDFASSKWEFDDEKGSSTNATYNLATNQIGDHIGAFGFRAAVFTGIDFYVYKGLYVGAELGFSVGTAKNNEIEVDLYGETKKYKKSYRITTVGFDVDPVLRLGWTF